MGGMSSHTTKNIIHLIKRITTTKSCCCTNEAYIYTTNITIIHKIQHLRKEGSLDNSNATGTRWWAGRQGFHSWVGEEFFFYTTTFRLLHGLSNPLSKCWWCFFFPEGKAAGRC
jgi:hypothetical protein